ncbi:MAG TPA: hypothetical protein PLZ51_17590 [Aggregatilineales bacterium]|nr:hypothetical protein [Aggregatilineales bacterium]
MTSDFVFALKANIQYFDMTVRDYMLEGTYQKFYHWALSEANPLQDMWLQLTGLTQLVKMTSGLLDGLVAESAWGQLLQNSLVINAYLSYEVYSDNLAIGITFNRSAQIRDALARFNDAMIARLQHKTPIPTDSLIQACEGISIFEQSLSPQKHQTMAQAYLEAHPTITMPEVEYNLASLLVANIETCDVLYRACDTLIGGELVKKGLVARYRAVADLMESPDMPMDRAVGVGADSILVAPTLAYYIAVIAEHIYRLPKFEETLQHPNLSEALQDAALIVRLLNDLGALVKQSAESRERLIQSIAKQAQEGMTLRDCIIHSELGIRITRLQKDATHGEFNLALNGIEDTIPTPDVLKTFSDRLAYLTDVYKKTYMHMEKSLIEVEKQLGHRLVSSIVRRFVQFHETLYSQDYKIETGEYAI